MTTEDANADGFAVAVPLLLGVGTELVDCAPTRGTSAKAQVIHTGATVFIVTNKEDVLRNGEQW